MVETQTGRDGDKWNLGSKAPVYAVF